MNCRETSRLVSDALDRQLTEEERQGVTDHLADCKLCQGAHRQFMMLDKELRRYLQGTDVESQG